MIFPVSPQISLGAASGSSPGRTPKVNERSSQKSNSTLSYRKNKYRRELIERHGPEAGLPLFGQEPSTSKENVEKILDSIPKAIPLADDTRDLAETIVRHDEVSLGEKQQKVLDTMYLDEDWTYQELARKLEWAVNRVVPRVFELRQRGLVVPSIKRKCDVTGMVVQSWRVK